jgi:magnesium chelatase subunit D
VVALSAEESPRAALVAARARLRTIAITGARVAAVAAHAIASGLAGIRGDLAVLKAARALAAWEASPEILDEHIHRATDLALAHRIRRKVSAGGQRTRSIGQPLEQNRAAPEGQGAPPTAAPKPSTAPALRSADPAPRSGDLRLSTDAIDQTQPGRRGTQALAARRVIGTVPFRATGTLAVSDSLMAAATRGARVDEQGVGLVASDLKQHERRGPGNSHVLFLVDASGSMATQRRLNLAKTAALALLTSSYQRRDEVALMVFRGEGTDLVLPFTRHVASVEQTLTEVPSGGRTPLARALLDAAQLLRTREPTLLVILTDGRANAAADGGDPWEEALAACEPLRAACGGALVIDCEPGPVLLGRARELAGRLGAECVALDTIDAADLTMRIQRRKEAR